MNRMATTAALSFLAALPLLSFGCGGEADAADAAPPAKTAEEHKDDHRDREPAKDAGPAKAADAGAPAEAAAKAPAAPDAPVAAQDDLEAVAQALEARRVALDLREREIIQREQLLESLERAAVEKTEQLKTLEAEASGLLDKLANRYENVRKDYEDERKERATELKDTVAAMAEEREDRTAQVVASLKGMRPSAGASLLASMNEEDAVDVLRKLSARQSAALLGEMPPKKAAELAEAMIGPRLPSADSLPNAEAPEEARP
jgi:flagellar motility protein MotE (MotC chaperone)